MRFGGKPGGSATGFLENRRSSGTLGLSDQEPSGASARDFKVPLQGWEEGR